MSDVKHTVTPWNTNGPWIESNGETIAQAFHVLGSERNQPSIDADFIVKAVNSHDQLVAALKKIAAIEDQMYGDDWQEIEEARGIANAALKQVGEGV